MKRKLYIEASPIAEERFSGVGNTVINIIRELADDRGFCREFDIVLLIPFNKTHLLGRWNLAPHIHVKRLFIPGKVMNLFSRLGIMPYMDIFIGRGIYLFPNFKNWPLLFSRSANYIHDIAFKRHPEYIQARNLQLLENNTHKWLKRTDIAVCVSEYSKKEVDTFYPEFKNKTRVVYNGVDVKEFYPRPISEQQKVCEDFDLKPKRYYMFFSNLEPRKNVRGLLAAYELLREQHPELETPLLLVGGMGWNNEDILQEINRLNRKGYPVIRPERFVTDDEVPVLLSGAIAMVHLTHYEGFGLAQLQTLACGTTLISSKNTSLPEILADQAVYVDKDNSAAAANAMYAAYLTRNKVNKEGITQAAKFTWHQSLGPLKNIIRELSNR